MGVSIAQIFKFGPGTRSGKTSKLLLRYLCRAKYNLGGPTLTEHSPLQTEQSTDSHLLVLFDFWQPETKLI